ncbi:hypothetical protein FPOAC1_003625 [Fusarium poae]|uniref:hypothetical protein n=1 Tax=Fusarium poae TaxID=36050 RepID=UPI001CE8EE54|nr:hypothetical protein FPOAC1_003625 [Fusarium poae]KAG8677601.1 hypothetical protein FPOAC1_003625 [Fusarium poae]
MLEAYHTLQPPETVYNAHGIGIWKINGFPYQKKKSIPAYPSVNLSPKPDSNDLTEASETNSVPDFINNAPEE